MDTNYNAQGFGGSWSARSTAEPTTIATVAASALERLQIWRERAAQRRALASLNERQLKDIGLSRADAVRESMKPFWQE